MNLNYSNKSLNQKLGMVAIVFANVCWGLMAPFLKTLLNTNEVSPWALTGIRITMGAALLWMIGAFAPESWGTRQKIEKRDFPFIFLASMFVIALNQSLVVMGMKNTNPIEATVILSVTPIFTVVFSFLFLRQTMRWSRVAGVALGFVGITLMTLTETSATDVDAPNRLLGDSMCLLSQVFGATYLVFFTRIIMKYSALTLMKWMFTMAACVILPLTIGDITDIYWSQLGLESWIDLGYIVFIGTCLCYLLLPFAQRQASATTIAMCNYLQPIVGSISSIVVGLATMSFQLFFYSLLIFVGIWLVSKEYRK
ncbi:MAG: DMT family transporter [Bacteroidaceae bacterium]|nr:DMT family transporter [Bacteroidaceae bacterium]